MSSAQSINSASTLLASLELSSLAQLNSFASLLYAPHFRSRNPPPTSRRQGYLRIAFSVAQVRFNPWKSLCLSARFVTILKDCGLPSNPSKLPVSLTRRSNSFSATCPNGGCPRSCASAAASTTSGSIPPRDSASVFCWQRVFSASRRATWATSSECVNLFRKTWRSPAAATWVTPPSRRKADEYRIRSLSR